MSEQESGQVSEQEKEAIEILETLSCYGLGLVITDENIQAIDIVLDYIEKLQKENEESKELYNKLLIGYNKLVQEYLELEKENQELKEENIILEGNKIGYKLAIQELEKIIDLIIDDFQAENYFVGMTNKEVREYYKKRKELKE